MEKKRFRIVSVLAGNEWIYICIMSKRRNIRYNGLKNREVPFSWRVEKMRLIPDRTAVIVNESLTLTGIPQECFQYRLGDRSALDWVIEQYQISEDKRSGIESTLTCLMTRIYCAISS